MFLLNKNIAHRGLHDITGGVPENSMAAFKNAINYGHPIELDIHLTNDGRVVVFHDDNLKRMCGADVQVSASTYNELLNYKLQGTEEQIPLLEDVLKLVDGKVPILIEFKNDSKVGLLEKTFLTIIRNYNGKVAVQAFNPYRIIWFRRNAPGLLRGQLASYFINEHYGAFKKFMLKHMILNYFSRPDFVSYDISTMPNKIIDKVKKRRIPVFGWTVRNKEQYESASGYCDSIIFESYNPGKTDIN